MDTALFRPVIQVHVVRNIHRNVRAISNILLWKFTEFMTKVNLNARTSFPPSFPTAWRLKYHSNFHLILSREESTSPGTRIARTLEFFVKNLQRRSGWPTVCDELPFLYRRIYPRAHSFFTEAGKSAVFTKLFVSVPRKIGRKIVQVSIQVSKSRCQLKDSHDFIDVRRWTRLLSPDIS